MANVDKNLFPPETFRETDPQPQQAAPPAPHAVGPLYAALRRRFEAAGLPDAATTAGQLLARAAEVPPLELPLHYRDTLPPGVLRRLLSAADRVAAGEPPQYVIGEVNFMGLRIKTDPRALVPRPETELLVETVLCDDIISRRPDARIADVGTGSGCIALALAAQLPKATIIATDIDTAALDLARENAVALGLSARIEFMAADLLDGLPAGSLDAVVSNPPYVPSADYLRLPGRIRFHEPRRALEAGKDGLDIIRRLIPRAAQALSPGGVLFLEIGSDQSTHLKALLQNHGFGAILVRRDYQGVERIVKAVRCS